MPKSHSNFQSKLEVISGGRDLTPFLRSVGMTSGALDRIKKGQSVSGDYLTALQRVANASLLWLTEDRGAPFLVNRVLDDLEGQELLLDLLQEDWTIHILEAGDRYALVLTMPAVYEIKEREVHYTAVEIIAGNLGHLTMDSARHPETKHQVFRVEVTREELDRLAAGRMSNSELLGYRDGRKSRIGVLGRRASIHAIKESSESYPVAPRDADDAGRIADLVTRLPPDDRRVLIRIIEALLHDADHGA